MGERKLLFVFCLLISCFGGAACSSPPTEDYPATIAQERAQKDEFLRRSEDIILPTDREKFLPLSYFAIDESYAVPAQLQESRERIVLKVPTSTGKIRDMEQVGFLQFVLKGQQMKLSALVDAGSQKIDRLSVMFADLTNGTETYQAGRYMELDPERSGIYIVDFNRAFHPYCYYNPDYDCPYPPPENRLKVPIRAGEKLRAADVTVTR